MHLYLEKRRKQKAFVQTFRDWLNSTESSRILPEFYEQYLLEWTTVPFQECLLPSSKISKDFRYGFALGDGGFSAQGRYGKYSYTQKSSELIECIHTFFHKNLGVLYSQRKHGSTEII